MRISILSRPDDAPGYKIRVAAQLRVLMPGVEFLEDRLTKADLVIVLIGPAWAVSPPDAETVARVEQALGAGGRVVPALVQKGQIPRADLLPESLRSFILHSAVELRHATFAADLDRMLKEVRDDKSGPWSSTGESGTLRIVSKNPGTLRRMIGKWDNGGPVNIKIDDVVVGTMHLFGDEMSFPLAPGKHDVLLRWRFENPVQVVVPAAGTVHIYVARSIITGGVKVERQTT